MKGCKRFLDKVWNLAETVTDHETAYSAKNESILHKTIRKVTSDIDALKGNTALAALMTLTSTLTDNGCNAAELKTLLQLLSPFAPHICRGALGACTRLSRASAACPGLAGV